MLRVTSLNVNGIRAAFRKGLPAWLEAQKPHIVCMQEIKISEPDLTPDLTNPGQRRPDEEIVKHGCDHGHGGGRGNGHGHDGHDPVRRHHGVAGGVADRHADDVRLSLVAAYRA